MMAYPLLKERITTAGHVASRVFPTDPASVETYGGGHLVIDYPFVLNTEKVVNTNIDLPHKRDCIL